MATSLGISISAGEAKSLDITSGLPSLDSSSHIFFETENADWARHSMVDERALLNRDSLTSQSLISQSSSVFELEPRIRVPQDEEDANDSAEEANAESSTDEDSGASAGGGQMEAPSTDEPAPPAEPDDSYRIPRNGGSSQQVPPQEGPPQQVSPQQVSPQEVPPNSYSQQHVPTQGVAPGIGIPQLTPPPQVYQQPTQTNAYQEVTERVATVRNSKASKKKKKNSKKDDEVIQTAPPRANVPPPPVSVVPAANTQKSASEEALLSKLVRELEFGTLQNSISYLNQLVTKYPDDPDYRQLLAMALRLRDGDVWYQYQRKVDYKEPAPVKIPATIIKPTPSETVNDLKKSSWFLIRSVKR